MRTFVDALGKRLVTATLEDTAALDIAHEIPGQVLIADILARPDPAHMDALAQRGALGRMVAAGPCLIEPFSRAPSLEDVTSCVHKQLSLHHNQRRDAPGAAPAMPALWLIAAGRPAKVIDAMGFVPMLDWPPGFLVAPGHRAVHLVVVPVLPRTEDTLLLRLLGRGKVFTQAIHDLLALRENGPGQEPSSALPPAMTERVYQVLFVFRRELKQHQRLLEPEEMEALHDIDETYEQWKSRVRGEGKAEGKAEGIAEGIERGKAVGIVQSIEALCRHFSIQVTDERQALLRAMSVHELEQTLVRISATRDWPA